MLPLASLLLLAAHGADFTLDQITSYPYPSELAVSQSGARLVYSVNARGIRNLYAAEGPTFSPRQLTRYDKDDGQELTSVTISNDGARVIYVRGGDHGSNWDARLPVNPAFHPTPPKVEIWTIDFTGGTPKRIGEGDEPALSPDGKTLAFLRSGQVWTAPADASAAPKALFQARGTVTEIVWSPDSRALAFVSNRTGHSFLGVHRDGAITWLAPSFSRDRSPRWSPDSRQIAFVRQPGIGGAPEPLLARRHQPWSIWVADVATQKATRLWSAPQTLAGSYPLTEGGTNLHWAANRIVFASYQDGWPHLYSLAPSGGPALLLTPGNFMVEHVRLSADGQSVLFSANTGPDPQDRHRRHIARAAIDKPGVTVLTPGDGLEWMPASAGDHIAFFSATTSRPAVLAVRPAGGGSIQLPGRALLPNDQPSTLITPRPVTFQAPDGVTVHAQLFEAPGSAAKKPAIVYIHGGPMRQMLLGWHYGDYYANAYALNQYLASRGFHVLAVNYRLGIGYGYDFQRPPSGGTQGAAEYKDIKAAGEWLARQPQVDASRIGVYGGSYGGFLTAMALGRDSRLFAAGVDIHGVHDRTISPRDERYEHPPDTAQAAALAWSSSPISAVSTWKSPVLIIHADDDRNVRFNQSTDLVRRLEAAGVPHETMVIVDDTHHFMRHANQRQVNAATAEFLERKLLRRP